MCCASWQMLLLVGLQQHRSAALHPLDGLLVPVQLYVKGEFVGGADICEQMFNAGELQEMLSKP